MRYAILRSPDPELHERILASFADYATCKTRTATLGERGVTRITVIVEDPDTARITPRVPLFHDDRQLVFYDGLPLHPDFDAFDARALAANWHKIDSCVGRHTLIRADLFDRTIEIHLDSTGSAAVYSAQVGPDSVLYTSIPRLAHALSSRGDLDPLGASGILCSATPLADRTLTTSVRVMPYGSTTTLRTDAPTTTRQHDHMTQGGCHRCDLPASEAAAQFASVYRPILARLDQAGFDVRSDLTGGRDSRAIAALAASSLSKLRVGFGGHASGKESEIVKSAAVAMQVEYAVGTKPFTPDVLRFEDAERALFDRDCGMELLTRVRNPPSNPMTAETQRHVNLGGHAGEIARWSFESLSGMLIPPSVGASRKRILGRIVSKGYGFYTPQTHQTAQQHIQSMIDHAVGAGVTRTNLQTVVVNLIKAPRWAAMQMYRLAEKSDPVVPFMTAPFFHLAMRISPIERFRDRFHYELIRQCRPGGLDAPFHSYRNTAERLRNEVARNLMISFPALGKWHSRKRPPHVNATWEPWIRPIFRDRALAHDRASPVWEYIDRTVLESALTDPSPDPFMTHHYTIYKAMTLICFWEWYNELLTKPPRFQRSA